MAWSMARLPLLIIIMAMVLITIIMVIAALAHHHHYDHVAHHHQHQDNGQIAQACSCHLMLAPRHCSAWKRVRTMGIAIREARWGTNGQPRYYTSSIRICPRNYMYLAQASQTHTEHT